MEDRHDIRDVKSQTNVPTSDCMMELASKETESVLYGASSRMEEGRRETDYRKYLPLLRAIRDGDMEKTKTFLASHPEATGSVISEKGGAPIFYAALYGHVKIAELLLQLTPINDRLKVIRDEDGLTPLHAAVFCESAEIAKLIVHGNPSLLLTIPNYDKTAIPLVMAANFELKAMVHYLYPVTPIGQLDQKHRARILNALIDGENYDLALDLLKRDKQLAVTPDTYGTYPLIKLADKPSAFPSGSRHVFWKRWIYKCIHISPKDTSLGVADRQGKGPRESHNFMWRMLWKLLKHLGASSVKQIYEEKLKHVQALEILDVLTREATECDEFMDMLLDSIHIAIKKGIVEFVLEICRLYPHVIFKNGKGKSKTMLLHVAILARQEKICSLLYKLVPHKNLYVLSGDDSCNSLLHLAAKREPFSQLERVSGPALQMQRELQWFQEVQDAIPPWLANEKNRKQKTAQQVFTDTHKRLLENGEKWMKAVSTSCSLVAALIVTIMFAATFTVPGGYNEKTGLPEFLHKKSFTVFIISDALSLFSSTTSVLMFLGILTSRYREEDFLISLPRKLVIGLSTLFFSIASMMVAFSSAIVITLTEQLTWVSIPLILCASIPVCAFAFLQFPLLVEIFVSTFRPSIFAKPKKRWWKSSCSGH